MSRSSWLGEREEQANILAQEFQPTLVKYGEIRSNKNRSYKDLVTNLVSDLVTKKISSSAGGGGNAGRGKYSITLTPSRNTTAQSSIEQYSSICKNCMEFYVGYRWIFSGKFVSFHLHESLYHPNNANVISRAAWAKQISSVLKIKHFVLQLAILKLSTIF